MTQPINIPPVQNVTAVAAVVSQPNQTKEAINDKAAIAKLKNEKDPAIKDKEKQQKKQKDEKESDSEKEKKIVFNKINFTGSINFVDTKDMELSEDIRRIMNFAKYKKARKIYEDQELQ